jgi:hypothetical protein
MPIAEKIIKYSVWVAQNDYFDYYRVIQLSLEAGDTAYIAFPKVRPADWLQFPPGATTLYMTQDEVKDVYRMIQTEKPVFFTALSIEGLAVGAVHTDPDLSHGQSPGELDRRPRDLMELVRHIRRRQAAPEGAATPAAVLAGQQGQ